MSHQTGIKANDKLNEIFGKAKTGSVRAIKIIIENEQLSCQNYTKIEKDWETDYDTHMRLLIKENETCYVLFRLDEKSSLGYMWFLLTYLQDDAPIRHKMLYASTKATLKLEFGSQYIKEDMHATCIDETTLKGLKKYKNEMSAPAPLTTREEEYQEMKSQANTESAGIHDRQKTLNSINCSVTPETHHSIKKMSNKFYNYLQFKIDLKHENIHTVTGSTITIKELQNSVPTNEARYHLYLFKHSHEGDYLESYIFIYSMPGYTCSIKERMMYSSCKANFVDIIESNGINIAKKLEISEGSELTEAFLLEELHPTKTLTTQKFAKPKGPSNRGAKRMIRNDL